MERIWRYEIDVEKSVGSYLKENVKITKREIRALKFRENGILVNGVRRRITDMLKKGDCLELTVEEREKSSYGIVPLDEELRILYEDEDVLVADKPAGILVHPSGGHYGDTLTNQLAAYFEKKGERCVLRPVGRLDKDTSGAVLFAKTQMAAARLFRDKEEGGFEKTYLALIHGVPKEAYGQIEAPIGRVKGDVKEERTGEGLSSDERIGEPLRMQVDFVKGKMARTEYWVLKSFGDCSLIKVQIATGRTHQIRVHMAYTGHPLLGDPLYEGGEEQGKNQGFSYGFQRAALHAEGLTFCQPFTGRKIEIHAPIPGDFLTFLETFGWAGTCQ